MKENVKSRTSIRSWAIIIAVFMFVIAVTSIAFPYARKTNTVKRVSTESILRLEAFSMAMGHFTSDNIEAIRAAQDVNSQYQDLSALLFKVKSKFGYNKLYVLAKGTANQHRYVADSDYRSSGVNGSDYMGPDKFYPFDVYNSSSAVVDQIFLGKTESGYAKDLVLRANHSPVISSYLAITSPQGDVLAILAADSDPGNTAYNMLGSIDLNIVGISALAIMALALLIWFITDKLAQHKKAKLAREPKLSPPTDHTTEIPLVEQPIEALDTTEVLPQEPKSDNPDCL